MQIPKVVKDIIPPPTAMIRETIIVLAGVLMAAYVISRFPALKKFVGDASITVNDRQGNNLY
ncbi:hypothetical protein ASF77_05590 [Massilia sp. Leaf139]|nr:hypothetical protein ASF77_05590 [Massilia sp. Leaf139]